MERLTKYIKSAAGKKHKILAENMPRWANDQNYIFQSPFCPFYEDMRKAGFGFCLDLASVAVTVNSFPFAYDAPPVDFLLSSSDSDRQIFFGKILDTLALQRLEEILLRHNLAIQDFLQLKPEVIHTRGVWYWDLLRHPREMTDLNMAQFKENFEKINFSMKK